MSISLFKHYQSILVLTFLALLGMYFRLNFANGPFNLDVKNFIDNIKIISDGKNIYTATVYYNYSPLFLSILVLTQALYLVFNQLFSYAFLIRTILSVFDVLSMVLIYFLVRDETSSKIEGYIAAGLFILNPVSIILTGHHGQFENIAIYFLLLTLYLKKRGARTAFVWLAIAVAFSIKHILLFHAFYLMIYWYRKKGLILFALLLLFFILTFVPYANQDNIDNIYKQVIAYSGLGTFYGVSYWINSVCVSCHNAWQSSYAKYAFIFIMFVASYFLAKNKKSTLNIISLLFLTLTTGIGIQYFILPIALFCIRRSMSLLYYTIGVTLFMLGNPDELNLAMFQVFNWNTVWLIVLFVLIAEFYSLHKQTHNESK